MSKPMTDSSRPAARRCAAIAASALCALYLAGHAATGLAAQPAPRSFASAEEAGRTLYLAVEGKDEKALTEILGAGHELVSSNDTAEYRRDRARFLEKYRQMHRLVQEPDGSTVLVIGAENWPFPIPLAAENGAWHFDAKTGMEEVLFRRIGENELNAIRACHALVLGQREHQWVERDPSMQPLRALLGNAAPHGPGIAVHGYYFRAFGSAFVARPAAYGSSGVMTFVVGQDDVVYAKDLGPKTGSVAKVMARYPSDPTWHRDE